jgi:hypothetical protein
MTAPAEREVVWNLVFTPSTFRCFNLFTQSVLAMSDARVRLVANGCDPNDVALMRKFAARFGARVDVTPLPGSELLTHGRALTALYDTTHDGPLFCFVDTDVKATGRFMPRLLQALDAADVVTSGDVAWSDDTVLPAGERNLAGRHAVDIDGFVYGTSYLAMYRREAVDRVRARWNITFEPYARAHLPSGAQEQLHAMGRDFDMYDTAKVLNILVQTEGGIVRHLAHPELFHVGGISQYLVHGDDTPWFAQRGKGKQRWDFARWAARTLQALADGRPPPAVAVDGLTEEQAATTRAELQDLVDRYTRTPG